MHYFDRYCLAAGVCIHDELYCERRGDRLQYDDKLFSFHLRFMGQMDEKEGNSK